MRESRNVGGFGQVRQRRELQGVRLGAQAIGDMTQQAELAEEPKTLLSLKAHIARVEARQHRITTSQALLKAEAPPNTVIQINDDGDPQQTGERHILNAR